MAMGERSGMNESVARRIAAVFAEVAEGSGVDLPALEENTVLDSTIGLESMDYAEIVVRLEQEFGKDPFANADLPEVLTFGEFVRLYE